LVFFSGYHDIPMGLPNTLKIRKKILQQTSWAGWQHPDDMIWGCFRSFALLRIRVLQPLKKTKVTLQRRVMIQNLPNLTKKLPLRSLTMQGAVSIEITLLYLWFHLFLFTASCDWYICKFG
jgi:hypothetical protein